MSTRNERFNDRMYSIDALTGQIQGDKVFELSDHGRGVKDLVLGCDGGEAALARWQERDFFSRQGKIGRAIRKLKAARKFNAAMVVELVFKNGNNRKESIWTILKTLRRQKSGK